MSKTIFIMLINTLFCKKKKKYASYKNWWIKIGLPVYQLNHWNLRIYPHDCIHYAIEFTIKISSYVNIKE